MWELDLKEGWAPKNWYFWTVVLEKTLESPLDCRDVKPVNLKGNKPWIFIGRTGLMLKLKLQSFGHLMRRADSLEKTVMLGKDWRWEEKGTTEDEMVGWQQQLNGHEFEQVSGDGGGQGSLACCSPWGLKDLYMTEQLNSNSKLYIIRYPIT